MTAGLSGDGREQVPVFVRELNVRNLLPALELALARLGSAAVEEFLGRHRVTLAELREQTNWVSQRFVGDFLEWVAERIGIDEVVRHTARMAMSAKALGFLYPFLRAVGSPRVVYERLPQMARTLNAASAITTHECRPGYARVEYRPEREELRDRSLVVCRIRRAQIAAVPTVWGLPEARITELECQARGDERCLLEIRWAERTGWWAAITGAALGLAAGLIGGGIWLPVGALVGLLAGRVWGDRRQLRELSRFNDEQNAGLREAAQAAERRFIELTEAKAAVERKVEERTAELQATSEQLAASLHRLEAAGKVKDEFLANVSHELRTPLTLILAPLEQLISGEVEPEVAREHLKAMHRSALRLHGMVNDLLELARHEAGHLRLRLAEGDLHALARSRVEAFRALAEARQLTLRYQPVDREPLLAWADLGRMEFVLSNLLGNAIKFTPAGGEIVLRTARTQETVGLEVQDSGPGIPPELQARAFERFERFDQPSAPGAAGAGIGLALVKRIVEAHGGTVALASSEGRGTQVVVTLKRGREHPAAVERELLGADVPVPFGPRGDELELLAPARPDRGEAVVPRAAADAPRLLIVEDHEDLRAFLRQALGAHFRVLEAADGEQGLELAARERPDLVVSDVMMPRLDGFELCRRLKGSLETRAIPVILLTARKDTDRVLEGFESGADDYLSKPFSTRELLARAEVQLRLRRLLDEQVQREKLVVLGTLAAGMAHEVRNPASAILAGLPRVARELEQERGPEDGAVQMVRTAIECAERISRLVGDLLDLGQPHREGPRLWDPHEGLAAALHVLAHKLPPGVRVEQHLEFKGQIEAFPASVNQIFLNLLDNAIHAAGEAGQIELRTGAQSAAFFLSVRDSGPGISPEAQARLFNPFFSTRAPGQGVGLGLYLSRRIAAEHGGRLEVESAAGQGACFTLWLPVSGAAPQAEAPQPSTATKTR